jgi:hypothetical protein
MKDKPLIVSEMLSSPMRPTDYMFPNATMTIITEHNIDCKNCLYGLVKNWLGISKICPVCNGTYSIGKYTTTTILR